MAKQSRKRQRNIVEEEPAPPSSSLLKCNFFTMVSVMTLFVVLLSSAALKMYSRPTTKVTVKDDSSNEEKTLAYLSHGNSIQMKREAMSINSDGPISISMEGGRVTVSGSGDRDQTIVVQKQADRIAMPLPGGGQQDFHQQQLPGM